MEKFEVDLDTESIWFDEAWRTREDLAKDIKAKLEAGDYQISQPSQAIELLNQSLSQMQVLSLRIPGDMAEALEAVRQETGRTPGSIIRQLIENWLNPEDEEAEAADAPAEEAIPEAEAEDADIQEAEAEESAEAQEAAEETPAAEEGELPEDASKEDAPAGLFGGTGKKKKR